MRFNIDLESPTSPPGWYNITAPTFKGSPPMYEMGAINDADVAKFVWAVGQARTLASFPPLSSLLTEELAPRSNIAGDSLTAWVKEHAYGWNGHWMGTVPMGTVLTETMKVMGVKGLRVCDNSIYPFQLNGNTQAQAWLAGEMVADFIQRGV